MLRFSLTFKNKQTKPQTKIPKNQPGSMQLKAAQKAVDHTEVTAKGRILCFWPNTLVPSRHLLAGIAHKNDRKHI